MPKYYRLLLFLFSFTGYSQSAFLPLNQDIYHFIDRFEIKAPGLSNHFHSNIRPYEGIQLARFINEPSIDTLAYSKSDSSNLIYLKRLYWEYSNDSLLKGKPFLTHFFTQPTDFYSVKTEDFDLHVSPAFAFYGGNENFAQGKQGQFVNTRGVVLRGAVNNKLGFYSSFTENQASSPSYLKEYQKYTGGFPYSGFTKVIGEDSARLGRDYMQAIGYLVYYPSKNIMLRLGHSKNFIGSGIRSLILSDFSAPYFNFAAQVKLGRLEYTNLLGKLNNTQEDFSVDDLETIPGKFMVFHHLNANITRNLNIGLFETVYFGNRKFDMNYLNPVIFYRFVEGLIGSSDNALVGIDFRLNLFRSMGLYGQFVLDEFNRKESEQEGWYGQKNALQLGLKYVDVFKISNLDLQAEFNQTRPYTFSHFTTFTNAVNYNTPIGHPLGANFREYIGILRYQPSPRILLKSTYLYYLKGYDGPFQNWGGNILKSYRLDRPRDTGNEIGQGNEARTSLWRADLTYLLFQNLFIDLRYQRRHQSTQASHSITSHLFTFGIRFNIDPYDMLF